MPPHEMLFWRFGPQWAVRKGNWKLVNIGGKNAPELFDLATDIGESKDLAAQRPEVTKELTAAYRQWDSELAAPLWRKQQALKKIGKP